MSERDRRLAAGLAAGAVATAAGAAALFGRGDKPRTKGDKGQPSEAEYPDEETSGRGKPAGGIDAESRKSGYDIKDASVSALVKIIVFSVVSLIISVVAIFYMFSRFDHIHAAPNKDFTAQQLAPIPPPLPHLQAAPYHDIDAVLMEQTQRLTTYGWNGSDHTGAHIPIERAIQQVIGKPLDASAQDDAAGPKGSDAPQPATPAYNADLLQEKPGNRVQGEGHATTVAPSFKTEPLPGTKP